MRDSAPYWIHANQYGLRAYLEDLGTQVVRRENPMHAKLPGSQGAPCVEWCGTEGFQAGLTGWEDEEGGAALSAFLWRLTSFSRYSWLTPSALATGAGSSAGSSAKRAMTAFLVALPMGRVAPRRAAWTSSSSTRFRQAVRNGRRSAESSPARIPKCSSSRSDSMRHLAATGAGHEAQRLSGLLRAGPILSFTASGSSYNPSSGGTKRSTSLLQHWASSAQYLPGAFFDSSIRGDQSPSRAASTRLNISGLISSRHVTMSRRYSVRAGEFYEFLRERLDGRRVSVDGSSLGRPSVCGTTRCISEMARRSSSANCTNLPNFR